MTDWRALCEELTHEVEQYAEDRGDLMPECANRARAALAEPEPEVVGPSDEELDALWFEIDGRQGLGWKSFARAVLARWGRQPAPAAVVAPGSSMEDVGPLIAWLAEQAHQAADASQPTDAGMLAWAAQVIGERVDEDAPAPPAEGEVAWLIEFLRNFGDELMNEHGGVAEHNLLASAADLLEQRHPTPVPVTERLPGAEDCDGEGRCWWGRSESDDWSADWTLATPEAIAEFCEFSPRLTWLPAHALPLPQGEVQL